VAQYDHDESEAICAGFVYRGAAIPALFGQYVFGDKVNGRVFAVPVDSLRRGFQAVIREVTLIRNGVPITLRGLLGISSRVDLQFGTDQSGRLYLATKYDGVIRRVRAA
jgi:hypothetical protein